MGKRLKTKTSEDLLLWKELCRGNENVVKEVYEKYVQILFNYGSRFTNDEGIVMDGIQEVFIDIYNNRKSLGKTNNIKFYLFKALKRKIIRLLNKNKRYSFIEETELPFFTTFTVEEQLILDEQENEIKNILHKAISGLPPRQKELLFLRYVEGMEYDQICVLMEMNYQSVRNLMSRTIAKLKKILPESVLVSTLLINLTMIFG